MSISELKNEYCRFYDFYQKTKPLTDVDENDFSRCIYWEFLENYDSAEESYQRFKLHVKEVVTTRPELTSSLNKILHNTRILRHRQKQRECALWVTPEHFTFPQFVGNTYRVNEGVHVLKRYLESPSDDLKKYGGKLGQAPEYVKTKKQYKTLTKLLSETIKAYKENRGTPQEKRSLEKLERIRMKVVRLRLLSSHRLGQSAAK